MFTDGVSGKGAFVLLQLALAFVRSNGMCDQSIVSPLQLLPTEQQRSVKRLNQDLTHVQQAARQACTSALPDLPAVVGQVCRHDRVL